MTFQEQRELAIWIVGRVMGFSKVTSFKKLGNTDYYVNPHGDVFIRRYATATHFNPTQNKEQALLVLKHCGMKAVNGTQFICCLYSDPANSLMDAKRGHWTVGRIKSGAFDSDVGLGQHVELETAICLFAKELFK